MDKIEGFIISAPVLLFSMVAHEYAHGYAALKQGDPTAYQLGRLTWNPLKHIDPFMTVLLPVMTYFWGGFMFGGAKPIPVVPRNYRSYKRGDIIVSMAGIVVNLGLAVAAVVLGILFGLLGKALPAANESFAILQTMMRMAVQWNLVLAMFNLMPIPPLDGSHVMKYVLPPAWSLRFQQIGAYGLLIMVLMMSTSVGRGLLNLWLTPAAIGIGIGEALVGPHLLTSSFLSGT